MPKITALYSRVSTDIQRDKGLSIPRQQKWLVEEADKHRDIPEYIEHFVDNGYSASSTNRPAYQRLVEMIEEGLVGAVIVYKYDRLTRNLKDLILFLELLDKYSVEFISISERFDTTSPIGKAMLHVSGTFAQFFREDTVVRVRDAMWEMAKQGKFCGGQKSYGYDTQDKKLTIKEQEAEVVRALYNHFEEARSFREATHWLNTEGYLTKRGKSFASSTVKRLLTNPIYKGYYTYGKRAGKSKVYLPKDKWLIVKGDFDPIISEKQFDRVQKIIAEKKTVRWKPTGKVYILGGKLRCKHCGGSLYCYVIRKKNGKEYAYARCHNYSSKGITVCKGFTVRLDKLEQDVLEYISKKVNVHFDELEQKSAQEKRKQNTPKERLKKLQQDIIKIEGKQKILLDRHLEGAVPKDLLDKTMSELTENLDRLRRKEQELINKDNLKAIKKRQDLYEKIINLNDELSSMPEEDKKYILDELIEQVVVSREGGLEIGLYEV